jgi:hypothetical protein
MMSHPVDRGDLHPIYLMFSTPVTCDKNEVNTMYGGQHRRVDAMQM